MIYPANPRSWNMEPQSETFDVETTFVKANLARKRGKKSLRGMDTPLYSAIWPMVYIMRIFGLAPYDFSNDRLVPSNLYLIMSLIFLLLYSYILYIVLNRFTGLKRERPILGGTEFAKATFNFFVAVHDILLTMFTRSYFVKIWNGMQDFDEAVRQLGYPRKETKTIVLVWFLLIVNTAIWTTANRIGMYVFLETWSFNMGYMCIYIGTSVALYKYVGMCFLLGQRFKHLNDIARQNVQSIFEPKAVPVVSKKTIKDLHNDLMITAESLNSLYSNSVLLWLANLSIHTVSNMYFVIDSIFGWWAVASLILCLCFWLMAFISQLIILHIACDYASTEANAMGCIMNDWQFQQMRRNPNDPYFETSLYFINRQLNFSAGGCFYVNMQLLRSIANLLSTYLVILLQLPE